MRKISLRAAILININIIVSAGIFLNITPLVKTSGAYSFTSYILGALVLIPFIFSLAKLAEQNPEPGGLYIYSKKYLSPFAGFISGWCYFIGKTVSAAFLAYAFTAFMQTKFLFLYNLPTVPLACLVIFALISLNIAGAHIGGKIQYAFIVIKTIPFICIFLLGARSITLPSNTMPTFLILLGTIPLALYPLMGFEVTCAIGHLIKKPHRNIFKAILWSFGIVTILYTCFQFFMGHATSIANFIEMATTNELLNRLIPSLVFTSVIAGSFGILSSNCWNLYALEKHLCGGKVLTSLSSTGVPYTALIIEGGIACLMLLLSQNQVALQSMSVFGIAVSFLLSAFAAVRSSKKFISYLAVASCGYILYLCFEKMQIAGVSLPYVAILFAGILFACVKQPLR